MISVTRRNHNFYNNLSSYHNCIQLISRFVTIIYCIAGDPPLNRSVDEIGDYRYKITNFFNEYKNYIMYFKLDISKTTLFCKMCSKEKKRPLCCTWSNPPSQLVNALATSILLFYCTYIGYGYL